jgi:uncharacterized protein DUF1566
MSYRDNGDGTVTDDSTGLMWEKKNYHPDGTHDVHDMNYIYSWSQTGTEKDGTAFTLFLKLLNDQDFANHSDWRLPTKQELLSIVDRWFSPAVNAIFGPTYNWYYWATDTSDDNPGYAWMVCFANLPPRPGAVRGYGQHQGPPKNGYVLGVALKPILINERALRDTETRCFGRIEVHLCCRCLSHQAPAPLLVARAVPIGGSRGRR